jgi:hypothetical protein
MLLAEPVKLYKTGKIPCIPLSPACTFVIFPPVGMYGVGTFSGRDVLWVGHLVENGNLGSWLRHFGGWDGGVGEGELCHWYVSFKTFGGRFE